MELLPGYRYMDRVQDLLQVAVVVAAVAAEMLQSSPSELCRVEERDSY